MDHQGSAETKPAEVALQGRPERLESQLVPLSEGLQAAEAELGELLGT